MRRSIGGLVAGAVALAIGLTAAMVAVRDPVEGADRPRWCQRFDASHEQARSAGIIGAGGTTAPDVVVLGDSYASGWKLPELDAAWPARLAAVLPARVRIAGYPGSGFAPAASECGALSFADRAAALLDPEVDLVVVQGGLNDHDQPAAEIEAGFTRLVEELRGVPVVVVGPPAAPSRRAAAVEVDRQLASLAAEHGVEYVATSHLDLPYLDDRLHLTAEGHGRFAEAVAPALDGAVLRPVREDGRAG